MSNEDAADSTPLPGYRLGREIGAGSFAKVYIGNTTSSPQRTVAIKSVLRSKLTRKLLENLESEISILKGIRHPHIVTLVDITNTGTHIHLIMEYCPLGDLSYFIKKRDKLGQEGQIPLLRDIAMNYPNTPGAGLHEALVRHFLVQLASALEFLRSKNLMHRDVKPQNLLLQPPIVDPGVGLVGLPHLPLLKLADFGFARYLQASSMAETLCGSPLYMAPEILRYEKYDATADLWSVGTVLYEMLVGKPPFRASNHVELLRRIDKSKDEIKFPPDIAFDESIKSLIRALLKRNPRDRMTFENFFRDIVLRKELPKDSVPDLDPTTILENSMIVRPSKSGDLAKPISVPGRPRLRENDAGDAEMLMPSPAYITDLIPVHTPPFMIPSISRADPSRHNSLVSSSLQRRETMPVGRDRPQISPGSQSPIPMNRRPSQKADTRPRLHPASLTDRDIREQQRRGTRGEPAGKLREKDRDSEGDYVVIEKKSVEVNAFADAVARNLTPATIARRPSAQTVRVLSQNSSHSSAASSVPPNNTTVNTLATAERRLGSSPTSALAKALSIASQRLFGGGSPPSWLENMVNNGRLSSVPKFGKGSIIGLWNNQDTALSAEEEGVISSIEEIAIRSNVVYDFAELKLRQLIPPPPSSIAEELCTVLTNEAIVSLCEEALVLYLMTLQLLQKNIDLVQNWMNHERYCGASTKLNHVVQWTRDRYNETLEKAEYLQQKKATTLSTVAPDYPFEEITAEKLLYDRALEMSRGAAVHEIVGEDLNQCEGDYQVSVLMLEAILETHRVSPTIVSGDLAIEEEDRRVIEKWASLTRTRLEKLRSKLSTMSASHQLQSRTSDVPSSNSMQ